MIETFLDDPLGSILVIVAVVGFMYGCQAWARRRSRDLAGDHARTGTGVWRGHLDAARLGDSHDVDPGWFWALALDNGMPARLELSPAGVDVVLDSRWLRWRGREGLTVSIPWSDVVGAEAEPAGRRTFAGKFSLVPRTDVHLLAVGAAADRFAVHMDLDDPDPEDPDDEPITPEEEAEWQAYVQEALGPYWRPGTAIVTLRTSAPDGLVEAIARSARGTVPA